MGICASTSSSSEIHDDSNYGHENAEYYSKIVAATNGIGSTYSHAGTKGLNQDSAILFQGYVEEGVFGGVFDGHGPNGHIVSNMVRDRLPDAIAKIITRKSLGTTKSFLQWKDACISAFKVVDNEIKLLNNVDCSSSGSTAAVVVKIGAHLIVANLGDSRAVLGTRTENGIMAIRLTIDLKPGVASEAERIRKCKGRVFALKQEPHIQRVWLPYDDSPGLAMSRAFGDFLLKSHGLICIPEVTYRRLNPNDELLVLASDGVWDVLSNEQVLKIASSAHSEAGAAKAVVDAAIASFKDKFPKSKRDDCTAICLFLQMKQQTQGPGKFKFD